MRILVCLMLHLVSQCFLRIIGSHCAEKKLAAKLSMQSRQYHRLQRGRKRVSRSECSRHRREQTTPHGQRRARR
ncbi:hypothetical protein BCR37DRAFT_383130 [Protomyces lactucae-debilis]|uniref:Secreted protein n=1 Tax=Protomyces lactucae-debilis TaxID=2754530 RepID=A0A1Y2EZQ7_PROLT|nr:uncharacterized protein BCR37DRAFT_383130 [Protomyces lactucae-debilis]ORY77060.1 hypothetical protein BCR37DRAFT_383130 [Protomyces lactucae-debilis]